MKDKIYRPLTKLSAEELEALLNLQDSAGFSVLKKIVANKVQDFRTDIVNSIPIPDMNGYLYQIGELKGGIKSSEIWLNIIEFAKKELARRKEKDKSEEGEAKN